MNGRWLCPDCGRGTRLTVCLRCHRPAFVQQLRDDLGYCRGCARLLRDPVSRARHYGPICWVRYLAEFGEAA